MDVVRSLADRIIVLHNGRLAADGEPAEVIASPIVQEAYLGVAPGGGRMSERLRAAGRPHPYRALSHPAGRRFRRAGGQDDDAARPQRRRQDDVPAHDHGPVARLAAARSGSARRRSAALPASAVARAGVAYVPETMAIFSDLSVKENLVLAARDGPIDEARLQWIFGFFPGAEEILAFARGLAVGRAEADGFDRARDHRAAPACC